MRETLFANKQHEEFFSSNHVQREALLILRWEETRKQSCSQLWDREAMKPSASWSLRPAIRLQGEIASSFLRDCPCWPPGWRGKQEVTCTSLWHKKREINLGSSIQHLPLEPCTSQERHLPPCRWPNSSALQEQCPPNLSHLSRPMLSFPFSLGSQATEWCYPHSGWCSHLKKVN